jgi:hypothetical protein
MTSLSDRRAAVLAGFGLLLMSLIAPFAILGVIDEIVAGERTAEGGAFWLAVAGVVVIALLDLLIAWALWRLFTPVDRRLAGLAGGARAAYAVVYLVAIAFLATASPSGVARYQDIWDLGLFVFGVHLVLVGVLCWRSGLVPRFIGALVVLAGAAYAVDSVGVLVSESYDADLASYLFVGEVVLMVWLIWWGLRGGRPSGVQHRAAGEATPASPR